MVRLYGGEDIKYGENPPEKFTFSGLYRCVLMLLYNRPPSGIPRRYIRQKREREHYLKQEKKPSDILICGFFFVFDLFKNARTRRNRANFREFGHLVECRPSK